MPAGQGAASGGWGTPGVGAAVAAAAAALQGQPGITHNDNVTWGLSKDLETGCQNW